MERTPTFRVEPFGHYFLLERIAVGGMAEIFKAKQVGVRGFEKIVVIKKILQHLSEDPEFVEMFEDEAKIAAQLTQANIVQIYELGEVDGTLYITMEYIDGKNLRDVTRAALGKGLHLSIDQSIGIMIEVLKGLDYAHRKTDSAGKPLSIIHRDMSPQNIIVSYEGEVKILDFGIAKAASKISKTEAGVLKGKFSYMSPEQASGKIITQTSDVYACGVIFHELVTSERLFRAKTDMETLERVKQGVIPLPSEKNPDVPKELDEIILKALAKDSKLRYQSASEMLTDLNRFVMERKINFSSQEISIFMRTLFATNIAEEKERLVKALAQIPASPTAQVEEQLRNARTHIAFKRNPTLSDGRNPDFIKADLTHPGARRSAIHSRRNFALILFIAAVLLGLTFYLKPVRWVRNLKPNTNEVEFGSTLPSDSSVQIPKQPTPQPTTAPGISVDNLKPAEPATPEPQIAENPPATEDSKEKNRTKQQVKKLESRKSKTSGRHPQKKEKNPLVKKVAAVGRINVVAPPEGYAELFIDNVHKGSVPGLAARDIPLDAGIHAIRCENASKFYEGKINVTPNSRRIVKCQDLR